MEGDFYMASKRPCGNKKKEESTTIEVSLEEIHN